MTTSSLKQHLDILHAITNLYAAALNPTEHKHSGVCSDLNIDLRKKYKENVIANLDFAYDIDELDCQLLDGLLDFLKTATEHVEKMLLVCDGFTDFEKKLYQNRYARLLEYTKF